jgi:hypothetical protein
MKEFFQPNRFQPASLKLIAKCNEILETLYLEGYVLTLRQLYYQLVARDIIPNKMRAYQNLSVLMTNARLAGLTDWDWMEDRTRNVRSVSHWSNPAEIVDSAAEQFRIDKWRGQQYRVEVWVEKDALIGVVEKAARPLDVDWFSCRGYTSISEIYFAAKRLVEYSKAGQIPVIIHLGDHDPSGIDMTRDIDARLKMFMHPRRIVVKRIALNMEQIEELNPPPNPAKHTDSRFEAYRAEYGDDSWELDALSPSYINNLVTQEVQGFLEPTRFKALVEEENKYRTELKEIAGNFPRVTGWLRDYLARQKDSVKM